MMNIRFFLSIFAVSLLSLCLCAEGQEQVNEMRNTPQDVLVIEHHTPPPSAVPLQREVAANPLPPSSAALPPSFAAPTPSSAALHSGLANSAPNRLPIHRVPAAENPNVYTAAHLSVPQLEQTLRAVLQQRLAAAAPGHYTYTVRRSPANAQPYLAQCSVLFDYQKGQIIAAGEQSLREQLFLLIGSIDQTAPPIGRDRKIIPMGNVSPVALTKILEINRTPASKIRYLQKQPTAAPPEGMLVLPPQPLPAPQLEYRPSASNPPFPNAIQPVAYQAEIPADLGGGGAMAGDPLAGDVRGMDVVTNFSFQVLPDLDVLIIDATAAEVARFKDMIDQIAELSKKARPDIEVYPLKHTNCISLNYVMREVYVDVLRTRQGAVRFLPMVNPNAMLLVGWGDAMQAIKDLIKALDLPVAADNSLMKVIKLKHASAQYVLTTLRGVFPALAVGAANAFAPRVQLFADTRNNALFVQAGPNDMQDIEKMVAEMDVAKSEVKHEVRQFKAKHTLASDLATKLNSMLSAAISGTPDRKIPELVLPLQTADGTKKIESGILSDVKITAHDPTNMVMVSGPEQSMEFIEELLKMIDSPSATAVVKVFPILYGDATSMIATLRDLLPTQLSGETGPQLPGAKGEDALVPVRFSVDSRINCIVAAGAEGDLKIIEALLFSLDREDQQTRKSYVYMLKSMQAQPAAIAINEYCRSKRLIQQSAPGVVSPYQQIESEVIVIPEMVSNSLLISATPKYYDEILELIKEIDQQPAQVVIDVLIGEVTLGNTKEFGAEFGFQDSLLFNRSTFSNISQGTRTITKTLTDGTKTVIEEPVITNGLVSPGWMFNENPRTSLSNGYNTDSANGASNVGSQLLTNFGTGRVGAETGFGGMVFSANSDAVSIMIRALQETSRLEILSRPQITAMNNQESMIHVGQKMSRIGDTTITNYGAQSSIKEEKVGLLLTVKPSISPDGHVVMMIVAEKSTAGSEAEGDVVASSDGTAVRSPRINAINIATMISAADNETVVLGGLISTTNQDLTRKVPLLAEIPVVGRLFRYDYKRSGRTELLIILTPHIVRNKDDMASIKKIEAARMHWCLAGVSKLHGDIGAYSVVDKEPYTGGVSVVYPGAVDEKDLKPLGEVPIPKQEKLPPNPVLKLAPPQPVPPPMPIPTLPK